MKSLDGVSDDDINKMTHLNAIRDFHFDPFAHRPREQCTVGALRAEATDVDTGMHHVRKTYSEKGVRAADLRDIKDKDTR
jgi:hypothetical protein